MDALLTICLEDARVQKATIKINKPHALRFADNVAVEASREAV